MIKKEVGLAAATTVTAAAAVIAASRASWRSFHIHPRSRWRMPLRLMSKLFSTGIFSSFPRPFLFFRDYGAWRKIRRKKEGGRERESQIWFLVRNARDRISIEWEEISSSSRYFLCTGMFVQSCPTDPFTILELQNPLID